MLSNKAESMAAAAKSLDLILNTVSADHDLAALIGEIGIVIISRMMISINSMTMTMLNINMTNGDVQHKVADN